MSCNSTRIFPFSPIITRDVRNPLRAGSSKCGVTEMQRCSVVERMFACRLNQGLINTLLTQGDIFQIIRHFTVFSSRHFFVFRQFYLHLQNRNSQFLIPYYTSTEIPRSHTESHNKCCVSFHCVKSEKTSQKNFPVLERKN